MGLAQKTKCREEFFVKKKGVNERRKVALSNLKDAKFFPKKIKSGKKLVDRSEETWNEKRSQQIEILEKRIR
ncbi:MAG: hypothetical protein VX933_01580 [Bacteroidota bacterium]|nr:hypothetical protein [Bacteroidota bacterium]|tara:strand:+ start:1698 stop:1913 length:216 start_codon:yes stop_codon:yes gene_type:complete